MHQGTTLIKPSFIFPLVTFLLLLSFASLLPRLEFTSTYFSSTPFVLVIYCYGKTSEHSDRGISRINKLLSTLPKTYKFVLVNDESYSKMSCETLLENTRRKEYIDCYTSNWDFLRERYGDIFLRCFDLVTMKNKATALAVLDVMRDHLTSSLRFIWRLEDDVLYTGNFQHLSEYYLDKYPFLDLITKDGHEKEAYVLNRGKGLCKSTMLTDLRHAENLEDCAQTCFRDHGGSHIGSCGWKMCRQPDKLNCACYGDCEELDESEKTYDAYKLDPIHVTSGKHSCWAKANLHHFGAVRNLTSLQFMAGYSPRIVRYALEMIDRGAFAHYEIFWPSLTALKGGQWVGIEEQHQGHPFGYRPRDHSINPSDPNKLYHPMKKEYAFLSDGTGVLREQRIRRFDWD